MFEETHLDISAKEILALPETIEILDTMNDNHIKEGKQRRTEARLTVIGDPLFQTSRMLTISGVANKYFVHSFIV